MKDTCLEIIYRILVETMLYMHINMAYETHGGLSTQN